MLQKQLKEKKHLTKKELKKLKLLKDFKASDGWLYKF